MKFSLIIHLFLSVILTCRLLDNVVVGAAAASDASKEDNEKAGNGSTTRQQPPRDVLVSPKFLDACTNGQVEEVQKLLEEHPNWKNGRSPQGETCLHVASIYGQPAVTRLLLQAGANPNVRSKFESGLRMTPLSWNVYAGHVGNARVLLQEGQADVNMDFDKMGRADDPKVSVTCLDIITELVNSFNADDNVVEGEERYRSYVSMKSLLLSHGAKTYEELQQASKAADDEAQQVHEKQEL